MLKLSNDGTESYIITGITSAGNDYRFGFFGGIKSAVEVSKRYVLRPGETITVPIKQYEVLGIEVL